MKKFITHRPLAFCALLLLAALGPISAQVSTQYNFSQSVGAQTVITGGTKLNYGSTYDNSVYTVAIPKFFYDGDYYTTMYVSSNGYLTFGTAPTVYNYLPLSSSEGYAGAISPFGTNVRSTASGTREVRWEQVGDEIVVQWQGASRYSASTESFTVQACLDTLTGGIRFVYSAVSNLGGSVSNQPQVGLRGPNNAFATNVNNRKVTTAANDWNTSLAGTASNSTCRFTNTSPSRSFISGLTYTWTPVCRSPEVTTTVSTNCSTNTYSIEVVVASLGSAPDVTVQSPNGTDVFTAVGTGSYVIGPIPVGTSRTVKVVHNGNSTCNVDLGTFRSDIDLCMTNGDCLGSPYLDIPDNGCSTNNTATAGIIIGGLNNNLGNNVDLQSVELIVSHANRGQLTIMLTSPTGQTRTLSMNNGGNDANIGDPNNCPAGALAFSDGAATTFSSVTGNDPTGAYQPDQTLAGFTGDPNGQWKLTLCDGLNGTTGVLLHAKLNFCDRPVINSTSTNSPVCSGTAVQLGVTASGVGLTYAWTGTGTFSPDAFSPNVTVMNAATGNYSVTVSSACNSVSATVPVLVNQAPTTVTANSSASSVCSNANTVDLTSSAGSYMETILTQGFNSGIAPWTATNTGSGGIPANADWTARNNAYTWSGITFISNNASRFMLSNSRAQNAGNTVTTLGSPAFSTVGYSAATLSFYHHYRYNSGLDDRAYVEVSTDGALWTTLQTYSSTQGSQSNFALASVNLDSYVNETNLYVRFRYTASRDWYWAIDNVLITGTKALTYSWASVPSGFTSNQQNPTAVPVTQNTIFTVTASLPTGCSSTDTTSVQFHLAPSATISYAGSPYCIDGGNVAVTLTGNPGGTYSSSAGLVINPSTGEVDAGASTLGTYTVTYTVGASGPCAQFQTTAGITIAICAYYSQASGNVTDPIWDVVPIGTAGAATFSSSTSMVVQNGHAVTNTANADVKDLSVQTGGTLTLNGATTIAVHGDSATFDGTLTAADHSTLALMGPDASILGSTGGPLDLWNLTVNTPLGTLTDATIAIRGTLQLDGGDLDASLAALTLTSDISGTGRLGTVAGGASFTGNMTVQRYIPAGHTNWRMLGSPVASQTVNNWQDDFFTAGYPGSAYPNFQSPVGSGHLWPSVRWYDETRTVASADTGITGVSSSAQALTAGQGFLAWSGDNLSTTAAFTLDLTGAPNLASTPITLPMTYTSSGTPAADGWNLVSNPVPSPIAFDSISLGSDVFPQYSVFNPINGTSQSYSGGIGQGNVNGIIQSSQGFWLQASGGNVNTTVSEADKVDAHTGGVFGGNLQAARPILRLFVASALNTYSDEATLVFDQGSPDHDIIDARKMPFRTIGAPQIGIQSTDGEHMAIDFFGAYTTDISIPVLVNVDVTGTYTISAGITGMQALSCLSLEDLANGTITPLADGAEYSFTINADDDANSPRFMLHGTAPLPLHAENATCANTPNGQASVVVDNGPVDIIWTDASGNILATQTGLINTVAINDGLAAGNYTVRVSPIGACGEVTADFSITAPAPILASETASQATSCPNSSDGSVTIAATGGTGELSYLWSDGTTGPEYTGAAGEHMATITDVNGCTHTTSFIIPAGEGAIAGFTVGSAMATIPVTFTNTSILSDAWTWDFGDGTTSTDMDPVHTYAAAGTYTVTLTATGSNCTDSFTEEVIVESTTSISTNEGIISLAVWATTDHLIIAHGFGNAPVDIGVYDATGRLVLSRTSVVKPERITLNDRSLNTGLWFVRVKSGDTERTFRVPLVR